MPAYIPTDFGRVLDLGIYMYYIDTKDEKIVSDLEKAINDLCKGDAVQIWITYLCFWDMIYSQMNGKLPFKFNSEDYEKK